MAVFEKYDPGLGSVGNYQVAGTPWLTSSALPASGNASGFNTSTQHINFPFVTKEVTVANLGTGEICIHLANDAGALGNGTGAHTFTIPPSGTAPGSPLSKATFDMKTREIFVSNKDNAVGAYQIYASVTRIPRGRMFELTGSGINSMPGDATITP